MIKVGIIPAAGSATRFGGIIKELLPLADGRSLLEHAIERLSFCDRVVVVTSPGKMHQHRTNIRQRVNIIPQHGHEMWGAMQTGMNAYDADQYYLTMPDTWMYDSAFHGVPEIDFGYGYFITETPERFGVLVGDRFVDKPKDADVPAVAWGVLTWSKAVRDLWNEKRITNYTDAINQAIRDYSHRHWHIGPYFDCADMNRYMELLDYMRKVNDES